MELDCQLSNIGINVIGGELLKKLFSQGTDKYDATGLTSDRITVFLENQDKSPFATKVNFEKPLKGHEKDENAGS
jgi:hypothetical protein